MEKKLYSHDWFRTNLTCLRLQNVLMDAFLYEPCNESKSWQLIDIQSLNLGKKNDLWQTLQSIISDDINLRWSNENSDEWLSWHFN